MFEQSILCFNGTTRKLGSFLTANVLQVVLIGVAVVAPIAFTDTLPMRQLRGILVVPAPPSAPPPASGSVVRKKSPTRQFDPERKLHAPSRIPPDIPVIEDDELPPVSGPICPTCVIGGVPCGGPNQSPCGHVPGVPYSFGPSTAPSSPPPPVVKPADKPSAPQRIRVSTGVQAAKLVSQSNPVYPALARAVRQQGTVRLTAIIGKDGRIQQLQLVSGPALLVQAAIDAIKQWQYEPTLLNGEPVEVVTQIDVNFILTR